ncbi:PREDICTED: zygote arrest protein 1-like [Nanorana parkeri]|uniref:zygote arrest protein 1-like n=1 Tax=Nanorana parkeri TaxID=125878 RepID=UPI000854375D|nr:PREDICTED: zygote arrest protein 1-like [Nanorana parkeri]
MAGVMYPPYPLFPNYGPAYRQHPPFYKPKQPYWRPPYKGGPGPMKPTFPLDCLDDYRWAQLKALLSQLGPGLGRFYTKEVGVQVNLKVDACVQCSLGPKTLKSPKGGSFLYRPVPGQHAGLCIVTPVRFPRTIAVYSRLTDRRLFTLPPLRGGGDREDFQARGEAEAMLKKPTFQFLEQKYGFFHCRDCQVRWESAYVWCVSGTNKVYFKQFCHKCLNASNPYYVESIECKICMKAVCSCPERRHIDLKRPHCQELCGRCKGQRLPCDKTYSFKYIV